MANVKEIAGRVGQAVSNEFSRFGAHPVDEKRRAFNRGAGITIAAVGTLIAGCGDGYRTIGDTQKTQQAGQNIPDNQGYQVDSERPEYQTMADNQATLQVKANATSEARKNNPPPTPGSINKEVAPTQKPVVNPDGYAFPNGSTLGKIERYGSKGPWETLQLFCCGATAGTVLVVTGLILRSISSGKGSSRITKY